MAANATTPKKTPRRAAAAEPAHPARLARLARAINDKSLDALLITNPKDVGYLTGFLGGDSYLLCLASASAGGSASAPTLISDFRYKEELEPVEASGVARIFIRSNSMMDAVAEVLAPLGDARIGVQAESMTLAEKASIQRKSKRPMSHIQ